MPPGGRQAGGRGRQHGQRGAERASCAAFMPRLAGSSPQARWLITSTRLMPASRVLPFRRQHRQVRRRQAQPVHAGVDMDRGVQRAGATSAAADQAAISASEFSTGVRRWAISAGTASGGAPSSTKMRALGSSGRSATPSSSRATKKRVAARRRQRRRHHRRAQAIAVGLDHAGDRGGPGQPAEMR